VARYDAIVVGAGPSGSVTAYRLASAGASVLLLDRARFPRDKPCGGGLTLRAVRQLPFSVDPVVEHSVDRMELRLRYGPRYVRRAKEPIILMTQRIRLDHFLAERAAEAGAELRDGVKVTDVREANGEIEVEAGGEAHTAGALIGADGANGITAKTLGLGAEPTYGVALEGNLPLAAAQPGRYDRTAVLELATLEGGYGWVFPKGDHLNFGVGGWEHEGPALRDHLKRLCDEHGVDETKLENLRGHRLPLRRPDTPMARGRTLVVGDAAGLIDPLSGDGMYECFVSARLAAAAVSDLLEGQAADLLPYDSAVRRAVGRLASASWGAKIAFDRYPRLTFTLSRPRFVWPIVEGLLRGDISHPGAADGLGRGPLRVVDALARAAGSPGARYRTDGA
jgi:geranylgeranyl reductase family protein